MKKRDLIILFCLEILLVFGTCYFQKTPGYMDAEYYTVAGKLISEGKGSAEPFIWNYLDNPAKIPHASFTYWMPLPAYIAAVGFSVAPINGFLPGRIFFILLSGFLPILVYLIAYRLTQDRKDAILAGFLSIFSGFYIVFFSIPESLLIYLLCGGGLFLLLDELLKSTYQPKKLLVFSFLSGLTAGLMHLSRADGLIWIVGIVIFALIKFTRKKINFWTSFGSIGLLIVGYLAVMSTWFIRNFQIFGSIFPPGNSKTIWITTYNQTFSYPSSLISFSNWWSLGFNAHLKIYLDALLTNLKNLFAVEGLIYLLPFIVIGLIVSISKPILRFYIPMYLLIAAIMTFVFPFAGMRGGFIHSTASFQPLFWVMVPIGLTKTFCWTAKKFHWNVERSKKMFYPAFIVLAAIFTCLIYATRVYGNTVSQNTWDLPEKQFAAVEQKLIEVGAQKDQVIITKDPPGYYWATGRNAIALPDGNEDTLVALAKQFEAKYVIIDKDHPEGQNSIFNHATSTTNLKLLAILNENIQLYEIIK